MSKYFTSRKAPLDPKFFGVIKGSFPASVREFVDQDYVAQLNDAERSWLARFNEHHYGADFRREDTAKPWPKEERLKTYVRKNAANDDTFHMLGLRGDTVYLDKPPRLKDDGSGDSAEFEVPESEQDFSPAPAYLRDPVYLSLVRAFRETCTPRRSPRPPTETPAYHKAKKALEDYVQRQSTRLPPAQRITSISMNEVNVAFPKPPIRWSTYAKSLPKA